MALSRALFHDLRQAFRMLEEPILSQRALSRPYDFFQAPAVYDLPVPRVQTPTSHVKEEDNTYLVEAELPGVKKQDVKVEFSDGGEVLHISGSRGSRQVSNEPSSSQTATAALDQATDATISEAAPSTSGDTSTEKTEVAKQSDSNSVMAGGPAETYSYGSFSNTFRFPRPVDVEKVQAKYEDGVLRLVIPKLEKAADRKTIEIA